MRALFLLISAAVVAAVHQRDLKRDHIGGLSFGDPYGSIGAVIPPVSGAPLQAGVSEDDVIPADNDVDLGLNSRYEIPVYGGYDHHVAKHSDHLSLDSHPIHLSSHPIPFHGHGSLGQENFEALCQEGDENYCYSPYNGFHEYEDLGMHVGHNFGLDHGVNSHHVYHGHTRWGDPHYNLDGFPSYVGNVLTNAEALRLGFDKSYLQKLGFDGKIWHHGHSSVGHHIGIGGHIGHVGLGGLGSLGGHCHQSMDIAFLVDGSTEKNNFGKFIDFISAVLHKLAISETGSRVALLTFAEKGELKFGFDKYLSNLAVAHALHHIKEEFTKKDGRKLGDGLKVAKTDLFDVSGRDEKHKILVVLTDGAAGDSFNENAQALRDLAVSIYLVGPKANLKTEQIKGLVSDKDEWFSYVTEDYEKMIKDVAPVFPQVTCSVDVVFVIDCTKGDKTKLDAIKAFIRHSISGLSIGTRGDHVAVVTYGGKSEIKFNLNKKSQPGKFQAALQELECGKGGAADGAPALAQARDVFVKSGHQGSINVTIYMSDSKTASNVAEPARALRNMGVRFYAIGYGKEVNEDDLKKVASLPTDYFVHVKEDENKLSTLVGHTISTHLSELKGGHGYFGGSIGGHGWVHTLGSLGGIGEYGGWGGSYLRSDVEPQYDFPNVQNLQDDTAKTIKDVTGNGVDQDGFSTSLSQRVPESYARHSGSDMADLDKDEFEETLKDASGVDRATIENESLSVPTFDASNDDSLIAKRKGRKDLKERKRTFSTRRHKMSASKRKFHKTTSRDNIEAKNDTTTAKNGSSNAQANNNNAGDGNEASNKTENASNADLNAGQNTTAGDGKNVTASTRGKIDPYSSIGSDISSEESAPNMKLNIDKEPGTESKSDAAQQKKTQIKGVKATSTDVHDDVINTGYEYKEASKVKSNVPAKAKEGVAVKKHMTKAEIETIESPVHILVKSIFHKAAKNVMKDFAKSTGLRNVAKLLVKAAVHNAMLKRPSMTNALKLMPKKSKKGKKKKKKKKANAERRSPKAVEKEADSKAEVRSITPATDDLMELGRDKAKKQPDADEFSIVEDSKKRSKISAN